MRSALAISDLPTVIGSPMEVSGAPRVTGTWLSAWVWNHTLWALALSTFVLLACSVWTPTLSLQILLATVLVGFIGLPHGAVDHWVGQRLLAPRLGRLWLLAFGAGYLGAVGVVLATWWIAPTFALFGFLAVSAFHFGSDPTVPSRLEGAWRVVEHALRGSIPIVLVWWFSESEVNRIFAMLIRSESIDIAALVPVDLLAASVAALGSVVILKRITLAQRDWRHLIAVAELLVIAAICMLPPLLAFTLYFCGWHSPRHSLIRAADMHPKDVGLALGTFVRRAWAPTLAAWAMAASGALIVGGRADISSILVNVLFIALSAVTLPHLLLDVIHMRWRAVDPR